ncbi:MAG: hypothetical protein LUH82_04695 [Clostridiales bacterium]|nr:hypothetical protein [Clostridiales bacterium]
MKKNKMMRLASLLLVAVLVTTCAISGTFAKYTTSGSASDNAQVAAFGVTVTSEATLFAESYAPSTGSTAETSITTVVAASTAGTNLVAPGTSSSEVDGYAASIAVSGTPEVAVEVAVTNVEVTLENWVDENGDMYCPLIFTIGDTKIDGADYTDVAVLTAAIAAEIETSAQYAPNTDLSTADDLTINWEWPYSTSADNDVKDTYLGDQAANGNAATIAISFDTTVTQID